MASFDSGQPQDSDLFKTYYNDVGSDYNGMARAAIEAMREPSEGMIDVVRKAPQMGSPDFDGYDYEENRIADWKLMIDAALKE